MRCAGALALLGLLNAVFGQFLFEAEKALADYAAKMQFKSPQSPLQAVADLMIYWGWLLFILAYLLPNGAAPILAVCRKMGAVRAWAAGWRGVWRNAGGTALAAVLATLSELAVRMVLSLAEVLVRPEVTPITAADAVPPMWFLWIKALAGNMFGLWLMLMLYAAYRDVFFEPAEQNRLPENADSNEIGVD